jgi:hypothetical protein
MYLSISMLASTDFHFVHFWKITRCLAFLSIPYAHYCAMSVLYVLASIFINASTDLMIKAFMSTSQLRTVRLGEIEHLIWGHRVRKWMVIVKTALEMWSFETWRIYAWGECVAWCTYVSTHTPQPLPQSCPIADLFSCSNGEINFIISQATTREQLPVSLHFGRFRSMIL